MRTTVFSGYFRRYLFFLAVVLTAVSCKQTKSDHFPDSAKNIEKTVLIQPFDDLSKAKVRYVSNEIRKVYPNIRVLPPIPMIKESYYAPRNRFRADTIIRKLRNHAKSNEVILGLTSKDISVTKGKFADFGVMGLGYRPGNACVASNFRVKNDEQFFKIAIHELGHTQGLHHCPEKTCFMRDAEGGNPTDELKDFCPKCKSFLKTKNWKFS